MRLISPSAIFSILFFHIITIFFLSPFILSWFHLKVDKMPFFTSGLFQKVIKNVERNAVTCRFFGRKYFFQAFLWCGTWLAKLYRILDRETLNMTIWFEGSFCVAGHLSKPLNSLKMLKLWLWSSAKDHNGNKKAVKDVYFALAGL